MAYPRELVVRRPGSAPRRLPRGFGTNTDGRFAG